MELSPKKSKGAVDAMMIGFKEMVQIQLRFMPEHVRRALLKEHNHNSTTKDRKSSTATLLPEGGNGQGLSSTPTSTTKDDLNDQLFAQKHTWHAGAEQDIAIVIRKYKNSRKNIEEMELKKNGQVSSNEKKMQQAIGQRKSRFIERKTCREWAVCETIVNLDGKQTYRELKRLNGIDHQTAAKVVALANRTRTRGNRVCLQSVPYLTGVSPSSLLPDPRTSRPPMNWKKSGRPFRVPKAQIHAPASTELHASLVSKET
uniref:Uncharacterized protein n=2 Tax=Lotharella globosa TaxID=91324 RepID=A0A6V3NR09_9EUKA|mmetsp:Transcript_18913/g.36320  ORF Transcript_18913/g.36320 Transcript_18913/m.36320 type:complete len:258 (+) Transcript_18913:672-1445(+)